MKRYLVLLVIVAIVFGGFATGTPSSAQDDKLLVVATTTQAYDAMVKLDEGINRWDIVNLCGPGIDPHVYVPTEGDIEVLNDADFVLTSGLHMEAQMTDIFEALGERPDVRVYELATPVEEAGYVIGPFEATEETGLDDPHWWGDPRNFAMAVDALADILGEMDPDNAEAYRENADAWIEDINILFDWADEAMRQVPAQSRILISSHDAFSYFGSAFGWKLRALQGVTTAEEAGVADRRELAEFIVENEIPVIFVEGNVAPTGIIAVQESVEAMGGNVAIASDPLYSDTLGDFDSFAGTYIGMIGSNVITIVQAFGYEVPPWPEGLQPSPPEDLLNDQ
ncbi:MAG: zinc ABC transporter solute-binding protein [Chloroflexi bacterium]|nr:zinc ABC transporter solute-binding protein [Chloroflexota bacterium]